MSADNKKAPAVRSGDEINPVLGSVIKIGGLIVIAALAVLITFILINVFKKEEEKPEVYKDSYHLSYNDFLVLTDSQSDNRKTEDLDNEDISLVFRNMESETFYIYFYYSDLGDDIPTEEKERLNNMDQTFPLFFVDLNSKIKANDENSETKEFLEIFNSDEWDNTLIDFTDDLNNVILNSEKYKSFVLVLNINENRDVKTEQENIYGVDLKDFINGLEEKVDTEE